MTFYAIAKGRKTGIFESWAECQKYVFMFKGASHKKCKTKEEAEKFIEENKVVELPLEPPVEQPEPP